MRCDTNQFARRVANRVRCPVARSFDVLLATRLALTAWSIARRGPGRARVAWRFTTTTSTPCWALTGFDTRSVPPTPARALAHAPIRAASAGHVGHRTGKKGSHYYSQEQLHLDYSCICECTGRYGGAKCVVGYRA